jgi:hypothetical protein
MKTIKFNEYETLKRGVYPATVDSIDEDEGQYGPQLKFIFRITSGKYVDKKVFAWASPTLTPKSKLTTWMSAIAPKAVLGPGFELDPDDLVGRDVQIVLGLKAGNDGVERNVIESLLPIDEEEEAAAEEVPTARETVAAAPATKRAPF